MSERAFLFIHALTSVHAGSGTSLGLVDLPVQRERYNGWPVIPGSSLKGVLRDECRRAVAAVAYDNDLTKTNNEDRAITAVFGPAKVEADTSYAGALSISDARMLAFPVRSLVGVFAWVTCPEALARLQRDLAYVQEGKETTDLPAWPDGIPQLEEGQALCAADSPLLVEGTDLVLEEFQFSRVGDADPVATWLAIGASDQETSLRFTKRLIVLPDDDFQHFVTHATEVVARVGLDYERKTVSSGALFYEEFVPPESLFYAIVAADTGRQPGGTPFTAGEVMHFVQEHTRPFIQIGADETIGKGICAITLVR